MKFRLNMSGKFNCGKVPYPSLSTYSIHRLIRPSSSQSSSTHHLTTLILRPEKCSTSLDVLAPRFLNWLRAIRILIH
jgi:hypothetical protein